MFQRFGWCLAAVMVLVGSGVAPLRAEDKPAAAAADPQAKDEHKDAAHKDGGHGHHDPHDIGHGNATANLSAAQELRFDMSIATFLVFMLLLIILGKFAWGPIAEGIEKREQGIEDMILQARQSADKAAQQLKQYEAKLAAAAEEAKEISAKAARDAEAYREQRLAEADADAKRKLERAVEEISTAKNVALREIAEKSVNSAIRLASSIVQREIRPDEHAKLIRDAVDTFPSAN